MPLWPTEGLLNFASDWRSQTELTQVHKKSKLNLLMSYLKEQGNCSIQVTGTSLYCDQWIPENVLLCVSLVFSNRELKFKRRYMLGILLSMILTLFTENSSRTISSDDFYSKEGRISEYLRCLFELGTWNFDSRFNWRCKILAWQLSSNGFWELDGTELLKLLKFFHQILFTAGLILRFESIWIKDTKNEDIWIFLYYSFVLLCD